MSENIIDITNIKEKTKTAMELLEESIEPVADYYMEVFTFKMAIFQSAKEGMENVFDDLKEKGIVPEDMIPHYGLWMDMTPDEFASTITNEDGIPFCTFHHNGMEYTVYNILYESEEEEKTIAFYITRETASGATELLQQDGWVEIEDGETEEFYDEENYENATEMQKLTLSGMSTEADFLNALMDKYGPLTDEKYEAYKNEYLPLLIKGAETDCVFTLDEKDNLIMHHYGFPGFCFEKNGKEWKLFQYADVTDFDYEDMDYESALFYKRFIASSENLDDFQFVFSTMKKRPEDSLILPLSKTICLVTSTSTTAKELSEMGKQMDLGETEAKNLRRFCNWLGNIANNN